MNESILINSCEQLESFCHTLLESGTEKIGLDFEGEFNLHRYGVHLCLIQIYALNQIYIIDPLAMTHINPIKEIFESEEIEKIIYACNIDVRLLKKTHDISMKNIFDIRIAAMTLNLEETSMPGLISRYLGISMEKDKKCQKSNWSKRPLSADQVEYAGNDVLYLIPLRDVLLEALKSAKKHKQFVQSCRRAEKEVFREKTDQYKRVAHYNSLSKNERIYLKHYYDAREETAKALNYPPYWVMNKDNLTDLARSPLKSREEWLKCSYITDKANDKIDFFMQATALAEAEIQGSPKGL